VNQRFLWSDSAGFDKFLDKRVVGCDLFEDSPAEPIDARIPDVRNNDLVVVTKKCAYGRSHTSEVGVFAHCFDEFGGTILDRFHESLLSDFDGFKSFVGDSRDGLSRE
jgi:hypothetical protein